MNWLYCHRITKIKYDGRLAPCGREPTESGFCFYTSLAFMLTHELDAVEQKEWRIFPGLSLLNDRWGYLLFVGLHVPLFAYLLQFIEQENFRWGWSVFLW